MKNSSPKSEKIKLTSSQKSLIESAQKDFARAWVSIQEPLSHARKTLSEIKFPIQKDEIFIQGYIPTETRILHALQDIRDQNKNNNSSHRFVVDLVDKTIMRFSGTKSYTYEFPKENKNYKLVKFLAERNRYTQTKRITEHIKSSNNQATRKKIGEINVLLSRELKNKDLKFIISKNSRGYRINNELEIAIHH